MVFIAGFLKQVAKGAAVQLGVSAVHETLWPRVKKVASKFLDRAAEEKEREEFADLVAESEKRAQGDSSSEEPTGQE